MLPVLQLKFDFAVWNVWNDYNQGNSDKAIKLSEMYRIRDNIFSEDITSLRQFVERVNEASGGRFNTTTSEVASMIGVAGRTEPNDFDTVVAQGYIPISPLDDMYRNSSFVVSGGSRLSAVPTKDFGESFDWSNPKVGWLRNERGLKHLHGVHNLHFNADQDEWRVDQYGNDDATIYVDGDEFGLTRLRKYMTDDDYQRCVKHVAAAGRKPGSSLRDFNYAVRDAADAVAQSRADGTQDAENAADEATKKAEAYRAQIKQIVDNACAYMERVAESGYDYKITPDENVGQLQVVISSQNGRAQDYKARLVDFSSFKDSRFSLGRVWSNGATYTVSTTRYNGRYQIPLSVDEGFDLLRFAMGEPVKRVDGNGYVGSGAIYKYRTESKKPASNHPSASVGRNPQFTLGLLTDMSGAEALKNEENKIEKTAKYAKTQFDVELQYLHNIAYVKIVYTKNEASLSANINSADAGYDYLSSSIDSSREFVSDLIGMDKLVSDCEACSKYVAERKLHLDDPNWLEEHKVEEELYGDGSSYVPELSYDPDVAVVQRGCVDFLLGRSDLMVRPSRAADEFEEYNSEVGEYQHGEGAEVVDYERKMGELYYPPVSANYVFSERIDTVKQYEQDYLDYVIGHTVPGGFVMNPVNVARYANTGNGFAGNQADIVEAIRRYGKDKVELNGMDGGVDNIKDRLIEFDSSTAKTLNSDELSSFMISMRDTIFESLASNGVVFDKNDVKIDAHGVVHWSGTIPADRSNSQTAIVSGTIGQIFEPDEQGVITTDYASGNNTAIVPGYEGIVVPDKPGENTTMEERTRCIGYEQQMRKAIQQQLRNDICCRVMSVPDREATRNFDVGSGATLNGTYRKLYGRRFPVDFREQYREQGMDMNLLNDMIYSESRKVRYGKEFENGSSIDAYWRSQLPQGDYQSFDVTDDNRNDPFVLTGMRNISDTTDERSNGYFDPYATNQTTKAQGAVRYLVDSAQVDAEGRIIRGELDDRTRIMKNDVFKYEGYDAPDRMNMSLSNMSQASSVATNVKLAQAVLGGWTMDDAFVVSKRFAEEHQVRNRDGNMRGLVKGDKLCDFHGNKGVISIVVDPDMSDEEAKAQGIYDLVLLFRENDLDVVNAPFSPISRFNGGTIREMLDGEKQDLVKPDGTVIKDGISTANIIVTDKSADAKTHIYADEAEDSAAAGRKASAQMAWSLAAKDCPALMREFYGNNNSAVSTLREALIVSGMDIDETGTFHMGYEPHEGENRRIIPMLDIKTTIDRNGNIKPNPNDVKAQMSSVLNQYGGMAALPFSLDYKAGGSLQGLDDGSGNFALPVLSAQMRSGQQLQDGTYSAHDYTNRYVSIMIESNAWRFYDEQLKSATDAKEREKYERLKKSCESRAQAAFDKLQDDVANRYFDNKYGVFRDGIMSNRIKDSATSIWTPDPRLDIDTIAISPALAESFGVKDGDETLIWRDPLLRSSGMRYMKVKVDDSLTGFAINPVCDKCFDGDFDGDTLAIVKISGSEAQAEARDKFAMSNNLLNYGEEIVTEFELPDGTKVKERSFDFNFNINKDGGLDISAAMSKNPELAERYDDILKRTNELEREIEVCGLARNIMREHYDLIHDWCESSINKPGVRGSQAKLRDVIDMLRKTPMYGVDMSEMISELKYQHDSINRTGREVPFSGRFGGRRGALTRELNELVQDCFKEVPCDCNLSYTDETTYFGSLHGACIDSHAKGSEGKFDTACKWAGFDVEKCENPDGSISIVNAVDTGIRDDRREACAEVQFATAVKSFATGLAGAVSQRGIAALRNQTPNEILELTYPVTQSVLQVKHDAAQGRVKYDMLKGPLRQHWMGFAMEPPSPDEPISPDDPMRGWRFKRDENGKKVVCTRDEWVEQFKMIAFDAGPDRSLNVGYNSQYIERVADVLAENGLVQKVDAGNEKLAAPLDRLSYGNNVREQLIQMSHDRECLFTGKYNEMFAPKRVRDNIHAEKTNARIDVRNAEAEQNLELLRQSGATQEQIDEALHGKDAWMFETKEHVKISGITKSDTQASGRARTVTRSKVSDVTRALTAEEKKAREEKAEGHSACQAAREASASNNKFDDGSGPQ